MPHTSAASSRLNWRPPPGRFKWTGPFRAKDEIWFLRVCHHISNTFYRISLGSLWRESRLIIVIIMIIIDPSNHIYALIYPFWINLKTRQIQKHKKICSHLVVCNRLWRQCQAKACRYHGYPYSKYQQKLKPLLVVSLRMTSLDTVTRSLWFSNWGTEGASCDRLIWSYICFDCGPGSSVGIATGYGMDGPGIETRWGARLSEPVQTDPGAYPAFCTMGTGSLSPGGKEQPGRNADPSHLLVPWSRKSRAIFLLRIYNIYLTAIGLLPGGSGFKHIYKYLTLCY